MLLGLLYGDKYHLGTVEYGKVRVLPCGDEHTPHDGPYEALHIGLFAV